MNHASSRHRMCRLTIAAALTLAVGCTLQVGPGGLTGTITLAGTTFTLTLNEGGIFLARSDAVVRNVIDAAPFEDTSADEPASGYVRLRDSSITIEAPDVVTKAAANHLDAAISGTATLRVILDAGGAASPCDTGEDLGTFTITVEDCVVTSVSSELLMSLSAVDFFRKNSVSLCLEMRSDFNATIRLSGLELIFGTTRSGSGRNMNATFVLQNTSGENIHLLMPGEEFSESLNRVTPGSTRTVNLNTVSVNDLFTIRAGRQQQVFSSATCPPVRTNNTTFRVVWAGFGLTCTAETPAPEPEACCLAPPVGYEMQSSHNLFHQFCLDINAQSSLRTREDCMFSGGVPQGPGTACAGLTCAAPFFACCIERTGLQTYCSELTADDCQRLGHATQPDNCDLFPCSSNPDVVACCRDEDCEEMDPELCTSMGGVPQSAGSLCAEIACLPGACCVDGQCQRLFPSDCAAAGGLFHGDMSCSSGICTPAACCWDQGCVNADLPSCMELSGGVYHGVTITCDDDLAGCAEGACCWDGGCTDASREDCAGLPNGIFQGWQSTCAEAPCATGACCLNGACSPATQASCENIQGEFTGTFLGVGTDCATVTCP